MRFGKNEEKTREDKRRQEKTSLSITPILDKGSGLMTRQEVTQEDLVLTNNFKYLG